MATPIAHPKGGSMMSAGAAEGGAVSFHFTFEDSTRLAWQPDSGRLQVALGHSAQVGGTAASLPQQAAYYAA